MHFSSLTYTIDIHLRSGACPGIRKRGAQNLKAFFYYFFFILFFLLFNFSAGAPAQRLAEKLTFSTKKVAKYR